MSYVVAIWEQPPGLPLPGDIRSASRLLDLLHRMRPGTNPKHVELIRRLTARYPDITAPECEDLDPDQLAWIDGPLAGDGPECVHNLGIGSGALFTEVRPFVIRTAQELGLNVFDDQAAEAHFADGTHVSSHERRDTGFEAALATRLAPFMARHGYGLREDGRTFLREFAGGWQEVSGYAYEYWPPHFDFHFDGRHELWAVSDVYDAISFGDEKPPPAPGAPRRIDGGPLGIIPQRCWIERPAPLLNDKGGYRVRSLADLDAAVPAIAAQLERGLLRLLAQAETLEGYDRLINPPVLHESPFFIEKTFHGWERGYRNVLAAHLTGNPRLKEICAAVEAGLEGEPPWSTVFFNTRKCIDHVRDAAVQWGRKR